MAFPSTMGGIPVFLVVDDDPLVIRGLDRFFSREGATCRSVSSCAAARDLLRNGEWTGVVLDVGLPDGCGLDLLAELRSWDEDAPVLVMTGAGDHERAREAQRYGAMFLPKPPDFDHLRAFLRFARRVTGGTSQLEAVVHKFAAQHALSPKESEVLLLACSGHDRKGIAASLDISINTVRTHVTKLRKKSGHSHLSDVVAEIHRTVFS